MTYAWMVDFCSFGGGGGGGFFVFNRCKCSANFHGPDCQQTKRSFRGHGYAWFPPLKPCFESRISLEFITEVTDGLLLYHGPVARGQPGEREDFLALGEHLKEYLFFVFVRFYLLKVLVDSFFVKGSKSLFWRIRRMQNNLPASPCDRSWIFLN